MKLINLKSNPNNPRFIKDDKFAKLVKSISEFPEMMEKRPIVCVTDTDGKLYPLGGNMRLKALNELKYKDIPENWVTIADEWTVEQRKEFVIKDNVGFGEWNWEDLNDNWDSEKLNDWGVYLPIPLEDIEKEEVTDSDFDKIKNENAKTPIISKFNENHSLFVIPVENEIDEIYIRELFELNQPKMFGNIKGKSNVISIEMFQNLISKLCNA